MCRRRHDVRKTCFDRVWVFAGGMIGLLVKAFFSLRDEMRGDVYNTEKVFV
jgi:hypothetical protein